MIQCGDTIQSQNGMFMTVDRLLGVGGQAQVYLASLDGSREQYAVKVFNSTVDKTKMMDRTRYLVQRRFWKKSPALYAPIDTLDDRGNWGHVADFAPGVALEEFLQNPECSLLDAVQLGAALVHAIGTMHYHGIAHGDIQSQNIIIHRRNDVMEIYLIDLDNFSAKGAPVPPAAGHSLYFAPEIRQAFNHGKVAYPDIRSDLFSLGVILHEILLLKHIVTGFDDDEAKFEYAMLSGVWLHDPALSDPSAANSGGYPIEVLNAELCSFFRRSVSLVPEERPSAEEWRNGLLDAMNKVFLCPQADCGGAVIVDSAKTVCPYCRLPYPAYHLSLPGGKKLVLNSGSLPVGRNDMGGEQTVSSRHGVFHKIGPEIWYRSIGTNGSFRWNGRDWIRLPDGQKVLLEEGDRLRFGSLEGTITQS